MSAKFVPSPSKQSRNLKIKFLNFLLVLEIRSRGIRPQRKRYNFFPTGPNPLPSAIESGPNAGPPPSGVRVLKRTLNSNLNIRDILRDGFPTLDLRAFIDGHLRGKTTLKNRTIVDSV